MQPEQLENFNKKNNQAKIHEEEMYFADTEFPQDGEEIEIEENK